MENRENGSRVLADCDGLDSAENKDVPNMRSTQLALTFDPSVSREPETALEIDVSGTTASTNDLPMETRQEIDRVAWNVEHLADAICRLLDWQDRMLALKAERRIRAMRTRQINRSKNRSHKNDDRGVVAIPQAERFRRFLSNSWSTER